MGAFNNEIYNFIASFTFEDEAAGGEYTMDVPVNYNRTKEDIGFCPSKVTIYFLDHNGKKVHNPLAYPLHTDEAFQVCLQKHKANTLDNLIWDFIDYSWIPEYVEENEYEY